jgi:WD40 repeat protein
VEIAPPELAPAPGIWIDPQPGWVFPHELLGCVEGVAFSRCGRLLALAHAADQRVSVYERRVGSDGFSSDPVSVIEGRWSGVRYPHDVDFSPDGQLLVVANRKGKSLTAYRRAPGGAARFSRRPLWAIRGRLSQLRHPDGVKFVPPDGDHLAAVNLTRSTVTFYRRSRLRRSRYASRACFVLEGPETRLKEPDGLSFSDDGGLLAVANHGAGTVTVYARSAHAPGYGPAPVAELGGHPSSLRCPHSVAFSRGGTHLAVSNAGRRTVAVYRCGQGGDPASGGWSESPVLEIEAFDPATFAAANQRDRREGGSKGLAFGTDCFGVCSPYFGLRVHRVGAGAGGASAEAGRLPPG